MSTRRRVTQPKGNPDEKLRDHVPPTDRDGHAPPSTTKHKTDRRGVPHATASVTVPAMIDLSERLERERDVVTTSSNPIERSAVNRL